MAEILSKLLGMGPLVVIWVLLIAGAFRTRLGDSNPLLVVSISFPLAYLLRGALFWLVDVIRSAAEFLRIKASRWLIDWLEHLFSHTRRNYLADLAASVAYQNLAGLKIESEYSHELESLFVDLKMEEGVASEVGSDLIGRLDTKLRDGRNSIWSYLCMERNIAIVGRPGAGKTTLMSHVVLSLCRRRSTDEWSGRQRTPVLLTLREHASLISSTEPSPSLPEVIAQTGSSDGGFPGKEWFIDELRSGRCLVLLDGLDEVADPERRLAVVRWTQTQMATFHRSRFIITSRPQGYKDNRLDGVIVLRACPFDAEQIETFVSRWYVADFAARRRQRVPEVKAAALAGAKKLLARIHQSSDLSVLATNPMLLTMMTLLHIRRGRLPDDRRALLDAICDHFLGGRDEAKNLPRKMSIEQLRLVLETLAFEMMRAERREMSATEVCEIIAGPLRRVDPAVNPRDFLEQLHAGSGLLKEQEAGQFGMLHKSLQEYLAACHVSGKREPKLLLPYLHDAWWHETLMLYAEMADVTPLVASLLAVDEPSAKNVAMARLLADSAKELEPDVRQHLEDILQECISSDDVERRVVGAEIILQARLRDFKEVSTALAVAREPVSELEYEAYRRSRLKVDEDPYPDHWTLKEHAMSPGLGAIVGIRQADAVGFCDWLNDHLDTPGMFRLPRSSDWDRSRDMAAINGEASEEAGSWFEDGVCGPESQMAPTGKIDVRDWISKDLMTDIRNLNDEERRCGAVFGLDLDALLQEQDVWADLGWELVGAKIFVTYTRAAYWSLSFLSSHRSAKLIVDSVFWPVQGIWELLILVGFIVARLRNNGGGSAFGIFRRERRMRHLLWLLNVVVTFWEWSQRKVGPGWSPDNVVSPGLEAGESSAPGVDHELPEADSAIPAVADGDAPTATRRVGSSTRSAMRNDPERHQRRLAAAMQDLSASAILPVLQQLAGHGLGRGALDLNTLERSAWLVASDPFTARHRRVFELLMNRKERFEMLRQGDLSPEESWKALDLLAWYARRVLLWRLSHEMAKTFFSTIAEPDMDIGKVLAVQGGLGAEGGEWAAKATRFDAILELASAWAQLHRLSLRAWEDESPFEGIVLVREGPV